MSDNNNKTGRGFLNRALNLFADFIISIRKLFNDIFSKKRTFTPSEDGRSRKPLGKVQRSSSVIADSTRNPVISDAHRTHRSASASRSVTTSHHAGGRIFSVGGEQKFKKIFTVAAFSVIGIIGIALIFATFTPSGGPTEIVSAPVVSELSDVNPSETDCSVTITFGGSVKLSNEILSAAQNSDGYDFNNYLSELAPIFNSDINIVSLFGSAAQNDNDLTADGFDNSNYPVSLLDTLSDIGVTHIMNASADSLSLGFEGLKNSMAEMENRGIKPLGTFTDSDSFGSVYVIEKNQIKIGIGAYYCPSKSDFEAALAAQKSVSMTDAQLAFCINQYSSSNIASYIIEDVSDMKKAGAEIVIVLLNWGGADSKSHTDDNRNSLAQDLIDSGVNIVVGTEPDYAQKITKKKPKGSDEFSYVFYSMGNLFADTDSGATAKKYYGMSATFKIERKAEESSAKITDAVCNPIFIHRDNTYSDQSTYLKYRVFPAVKYYSESECPNFFSENSQWKASKTAFDAIYNYAKNATDGMKVGTYNDLFPAEESEERVAEGFSGTV